MKKTERKSECVTSATECLTGRMAVIMARMCLPGQLYIHV